MPSVTKTIKLDIKHCNFDSLRRPIVCGVQDVLNTFKKIMMHWLIFKDLELQRCHHFFLTPFKNILAMQFCTILNQLVEIR